MSYNHIKHDIIYIYIYILDLSGGINMYTNFFFDKEPHQCNQSWVLKKARLDPATWIFNT